MPRKKRSKRKARKGDLYPAQVKPGPRTAVATDIAPPVGRPKKGLETLPEGWENGVLDLYRNGASDCEIRVWIRDQGTTLSKDLWYRWLEEEPEFSETIKRGQDLAEAWWQTTGRALTVGAMKGNAAVWFMNMKNRFGYQDKVEVEAKVTVNPLDAIADECSSRPIYDVHTRRDAGEPQGSVLEAQPPVLDPKQVGRKSTVPDERKPADVLEGDVVPERDPESPPAGVHDGDSGLLPRHVTVPG